MVMTTSLLAAGQDVCRFAWNDLNVPRLLRRATAERGLRLGVLAIVLVVAVLGSGCSDSGGDDAASTSTAARPSTTTTAAPEDETADVIAAFNEAALAAIRAGMIPDPDYPDLERTHTGPMLEQAREVLRGYQLRKIKLRYPEPLESGFEVTVASDAVELAGDTAVFEACAIDRGERINAETGEVISSNEDPAVVHMRVGMRLVDGTWKLAERRNLDTAESDEGCAA